MNERPSPDFPGLPSHFQTERLHNTMDAVDALILAFLVPPSATTAVPASPRLLLSAVSTCFAMNIPMVAPVFPAGKEPLPPDITEEERENYMQARKYQNWMTTGMESCVAKTVIAGGGGASPPLSFCFFCAVRWGGRWEFTDREGRG